MQLSQNAHLLKSGKRAKDYYIGKINLIITMSILISLAYLPGLRKMSMVWNRI